MARHSRMETLLPAFCLSVVMPNDREKLSDQPSDLDVETMAQVAGRVCRPLKPDQDCVQSGADGLREVPSYLLLPLFGQNIIMVVVVDFLFLRYCHVSFFCVCVELGPINIMVQN